MQTEGTDADLNYWDSDLVTVSIRNPWMEYFTSFYCVTILLSVFELYSRGTSSKDRQLNQKAF